MHVASCVAYEGMRLPGFEVLRPRKAKASIIHPSRSQHDKSKAPSQHQFCSHAAASRVPPRLEKTPQICASSLSGSLHYSSPVPVPLPYKYLPVERPEKDHVSD